MITRENGETLFAVQTHAGMCGTDAIDGIWAKNIEEAVAQMIDWGWEHFWNYNSEEDFEDIEAELDIWAEPWDDAVHPYHWPGGCKYSHEFKQDLK